MSSVQANALAEPGGLSAGQVQLLSALAASIAEAPGLPTLVARLGAGLWRLVDFDQIALALRGADGKSWGLVRPRLATTPEPAWMELRDPDSPLEEAMALGALARRTRATASLLPPGLEATSPIRDLSSFPSALCLPLNGPDGPLGAFGLFSARPGAYGGGELLLLQLVTPLVEAAARKLVLLDELARAERELGRVDRLKGELTQLLVHDLQHPVTVLESGLEFLHTALLPDDAGEARAVVEELRVAAAGLGEMVGTLLDLDRLEEGSLPLKRQPVAVGDWLRARAQGQMPAARLSEVQLTARCEPEGARVLFDPQLLGRVVDNLVANALRHTPKRGQVALVARLAHDSLTLAVADTGPGVPADQRDRLFTKYGQLVGSGELSRPGRGLGLYFCKLAVELHGGTIGVEATPGGGALFRISLPL